MLGFSKGPRSAVRVSPGPSGRPVSVKTDRVRPEAESTTSAQIEVSWEYKRSCVCLEKRGQAPGWGMRKS